MLRMGHVLAILVIIVSITSIYYPIQTAQSQNTACPAIYDPVCGVDGVTYGNSCEADVAGVEILHEGECREPEPTLQEQIDVLAFVIGQLFDGISDALKTIGAALASLQTQVDDLEERITALEDPPGSITSVITIITVDSAGREIPGVTTIFKQSGVTLQTGVSPEIFFATNGETYEVFLDIFEGRNFIRWSDGTSANPRTFSITSDTTFTGVYTPPPPGPTLTVFVNEQDITEFSGPQIVKVVVNNPDLKDTDEQETEPDVTLNNVSLNGHKLRMVQEVDGNWYGYFSDRDSALIADSQAVTPGTGLDFGVFCSRDSGFVLGPTIIISDTEGFAIQDPALVTNEVNGNPDATPLTNLCTDPVPNVTPNDLMNVLDGGTMTPAGSLTLQGQIGIRDGFWPFIQLYPFDVNDEVMIKYDIGGGPPEVITLTFGSVPEPTLKELACAFGNGEIFDTVYLEGNQALLDSGDLILPGTSSISSNNSLEPIPDWVKNNAGWWCDGVISYSDYESSLLYLLNQGYLH